MNDQMIGDLALQAAQGSVDAFQNLYRLTRQSAWFVALSITKNESDAQDILQESYLKAYQSLQQLAQPEKFVPWLNQIVANKAKNYIARKKPAFFAEYDDENAQDWQEETNPEFLPDEHLDQSEAKALIASLVTQLPEDQRLVVLLRYYDDMEVADIAKSLEIPEGTVKSRLSRAREKLAVMLNEAKNRGIKLYSVAPIPLLAYFIKLLGFDAPGSDRLPPLLIGSAAAAGAAGGTAVAARSTLVGKVAAIATAAVVAVGGVTTAVVYTIHKRAALADNPAHAVVIDHETIANASQESDSMSSVMSYPAITLPTDATTGAEQSGADNKPIQQKTTQTSASQTATQPSSTSSVNKTTKKVEQATTAAKTTIKTTQSSTEPFSLPKIVLPTFTTRSKTTTTSTTESNTTKPAVTISQTTTTTRTTTTTTTTTTVKVDEFTYKQVSDGTLMITKYNGTATSIVIPSQIDGVEVRHLDVNAFEGTRLVKVVISPGIDCLRTHTFGRCTDLAEVVIPPSVRYFQADVFDGSPNVVIVCTEGSEAQKYAEDNNIPFRFQ